MFLLNKYLEIGDIFQFENVHLYARRFIMFKQHCIRVTKHLLNTDNVAKTKLDRIFILTEDVANDNFV